jgi:sarcosine oxidase subunit beta
MDRANVLIAGGGIIGTSIAWSLASRGVDDIVVVDLDLAGVYASSELNAGGVRASWWQPVNIATCAATLDFFRAHRSEFGFRECGYLWLYDDDGRFACARRKRDLQNSFGLAIEILTSDEVCQRFPVIDRATDELVGGTLSPGDGLVNPNAVRSWYRREAEALGAVFLDRHYIGGVSTAHVATAGTSGGRRRVESVDVIEVSSRDPTDADGAIREILTTHRVRAERVRGESRIRCGVLVNCLGAWSPVFSAKIGVSDVTEPVRRQISLVDVHLEDRVPGIDFERMGMIVDASNLYFHPEGPHILAGYSIPDEPPGYDFAYHGRDFFERFIWPRLGHRFSSFERCGHVRGWAGLYAVTPDRSGIAGATKGFENLFEAHSFTGRGVMQSYGIATALSELIIGGRSQDFDIAPLARDRFADRARWVVEELHI